MREPMQRPARTEVKVPSVITRLRAGEQLGELGMAAARLWLDRFGFFGDRDGSLGEAVAAYWGSPSRDRYDDFLEGHDRCTTCGEGYRFENLSICPNCLKTYCYRHNEECACGFKLVG